MQKNNIKMYIKKYMPSFIYPLYIRYKYYKDVGRVCNLSNPCTYTEKMQWSKLHRKSPMISYLSDKIEVRKYVAEKVGEEYLVPSIGNVYSSAEEINFNSLPKSFVIKANHGSGFNCIVNDKNALDYDEIKKMVDGWLRRDYSLNSLELQYRTIEPKVYIEKNLLDEGITDLPDYKFFCFNGKVFCSYTMTDYVFDHSRGRLGFFDRDYCLMPYYRSDYLPIEEQLPKPQNYEKMVEIAEKLSEGFSHVRVDLYNLGGKIYFGEMTFTTSSGYIKFVPAEFDTILGKQWNLNLGI